MIITILSIVIQFVDDWMHIHLRNKILKKNKVELKVKFFCNQIFH